MNSRGFLFKLVAFGMDQNRQLLIEAPYINVLQIRPTCPSPQWESHRELFAAMVRKRFFTIFSIAADAMAAVMHCSWWEHECWGCENIDVQESAPFQWWEHDFWVTQKRDFRKCCYFLWWEHDSWACENIDFQEAAPFQWWEHDFEGLEAQNLRKMLFFS